MQTSKALNNGMLSIRIVKLAQNGIAICSPNAFVEADVKNNLIKYINEHREGITDLVDDGKLLHWNYKDISYKVQFFLPEEESTVDPLTQMIGNISIQENGLYELIINDNVTHMTNPSDKHSIDWLGLVKSYSVVLVSNITDTVINDVSSALPESTVISNSNQLKDTFVLTDQGSPIILLDFKDESSDVKYESLFTELLRNGVQFIADTSWTSEFLKINVYGDVNMNITTTMGYDNRVGSSDVFNDYIKGM